MKKNRVFLYELLKRFLWWIGIEQINEFDPQVLKGASLVKRFVVNLSRHPNWVAKNCKEVLFDGAKVELRFAAFADEMLRDVSIPIESFSLQRRHAFKRRVHSTLTWTERASQHHARCLCSTRIRSNSGFSLGCERRGINLFAVEFANDLLVVILSLNRCDVSTSLLNEYFWLCWKPEE